MKIAKYAIIAALLGYSVAAKGAVRNRLSQVKTLQNGFEACDFAADVVEPSLEFCDCSLVPPPPAPGSGGASEITLYNGAAEVTVGSTTQSIPNGSSSTDCNLESCGCEEKTEGQCWEANSERTWCLDGNIHVEGSKTKKGKGRAQDVGRGRGEAVSTCYTINSAGSGAPPATPPTVCVTVPSLPSGAIC